MTPYLPANYKMLQKHILVMGGITQKACFMTEMFLFLWHKTNVQHIESYSSWKCKQILKTCFYVINQSILILFRPPSYHIAGVAYNFPEAAHLIVLDLLVDSV